MRSKSLFILLAIWMAPCFAAEDTSARILAGAQKQAAEHTAYVPGYVSIGYPNGDVPRAGGVCTDVVVRSFRAAGIDLQKLIHDDMLAAFDQYPRKYGLSQPDSNIDHRRVPNQMRFFSRKGTAVTMEVSPETLGEWKVGDIVYWKLNNGLDHCGVISSRRNAAGVPLVIHNIGNCSEDDCLTKWKIIGHYRYPKQAP